MIYDDKLIIDKINDKINDKIDILKLYNYLLYSFFLLKYNNKGQIK